MRLFIVSGTSGAGKSVALHALEDLGIHCIDNLPMALLPAFARELAETPLTSGRDAAVGLDVRNLTKDLSAFDHIREELDRTGLEVSTVFLDAYDATLIKRFSETRRRHPLTEENRPLEEAIHRERQLLDPIAERADIFIDTSELNIHQLRERIQSRVAHQGSATMSLLFQSFGFKHGIPIEADFVFDIRCLPNPHWEPRLRPLTGQHREIKQFLQQHPEVNEMYQQVRSFLESWIPRFEADRRNYLTVAIGCTGGQHRSVYLAERLAEHFSGLRSKVLVRHRELS